MWQKKDKKKTFATRKTTFTSDCFIQNVCIWQQAQCFYMDVYNDVINRLRIHRNDAIPFQPIASIRSVVYVYLICVVCLGIAAISVLCVRSVATRVRALFTVWEASKNSKKKKKKNRVDSLLDQLNCFYLLWRKLSTYGSNYNP